MRTAVVVFPGSNCDRDVQRAVAETLKTPVDMVWHEEREFASQPDLVILPGGFSYGDYLRSGAMAARSPIIEAVRRHAEAGKLLLGICNGFQVLTETKLLPGALLANTSTTFLCKKCWMRVERTDNRFTSGFKKGDIVQYPIAHHEGLYFLPDKELRELEESGRVVFRYADPQTGEAGAEYAPNGALNGIAGICNKEGNILGLMPHPERATIAHLNGGSDGGDFWRSIAQDFAKRGAL
ncbi:phosphoribosylformylglycinamidine synthase subunit PurQ [Cloacibacillus porcorum]|jgi:phosphoribosylformylglycinamidine synthase subunit PurQ / glutaminase|uniref:Phosphoribosylformylglycinamidine synthase subunit PurQ n=1 Tax=Cloacibacillus porcorum TaxID=1197717 RepID=A0A1B2I4J0_9BACT|nr:phosphoribosylformylglycinamidine synthase subunit PurQ [Cloacibacillus porcorum]ANZ44894.1 phosphoribosylformylglycinamidine synthase I [Cloacibacillus porcorum]MCC8185336.1 phosphoribosylformylglycinamidine synthase subunit PurQ [Cloacibacillus porcorum]MCD8234190.1 phosphoribosylformylglycinamidine synthase subunit PurQ [Cloacibacillus porcorum]MCI5864720.1 phosphoribosylformylglycinamidine synthase subunit PurQ [Cloacibacillus porcorum]MDD7648086.1 phosphoribosylformylglycinamidine synt